LQGLQLVEMLEDEVVDVRDVLELMAERMDLVEHDPRRIRRDASNRPVVLAGRGTSRFEPERHEARARVVLSLGNATVTKLWHRPEKDRARALHIHLRGGGRDAVDYYEENQNVMSHAAECRPAAWRGR